MINNITKYNILINGYNHFIILISLCIAFIIQIAASIMYDNQAFMNKGLFSSFIGTKDKDKK